MHESLTTDATASTSTHRPNLAERPVTNACEHDRRAARRIDMRIPVELRGSAGVQSRIVRTCSRNVSTTGLLVEVEGDGFQMGDPLNIELMLPPAEGVSSEPCRATCSGHVVRVEPVGGAERRPGRSGLGIQFSDRLRLALVGL